MDDKSRDGGSRGDDINRDGKSRGDNKSGKRWYK